ncbi:MAG: M15 family metallopeptidase [Cyanobacteria bacterium]|nr:M15 family metallopeptidase [Cyanobacteriota bacterium]
MEKTHFEELSSTLREEMIRLGVWSDACPVPLDRLAALPISHVDFDGHVQDNGELIIFDVLASSAKRIFDSLLEMKFPVSSVRPVNEFGGQDSESMKCNNSSCFAFRQVAGTSTVSMHGYGMAIDLNPLQNPFVTFDEEAGTAVIEPSAGWQFLNRHNRKDGMVEDVVSLFKEHGFTIWGGRWTTPIDFHHFQPPRAVAELLVAMNRSDGEKFFELFIASADVLSALPWGEKLKPVIQLYSSERERFFSLAPEEIVAVANV